MSAKTLQNIFFIWFIALTCIALYNLYHNVTDTTSQTVLERTYAENKDRYEASIKEHDQFKADIQYLKGRVDAIRPCH